VALLGLAIVGVEAFAAENEDGMTALVESDPLLLV
jgi:hypothetical protein